MDINELMFSWTGLRIVIIAFVISILFTFGMFYITEPIRKMDEKKQIRKWQLNADLVIIGSKWNIIPPQKYMYKDLGYGIIKDVKSKNGNTKVYVDVYRTNGEFRHNTCYDLKYGSYFDFFEYFKIKVS